MYRLSGLWTDKVFGLSLDALLPFCLHSRSLLLQHLGAIIELQLTAGCRATLFGDDAEELVVLERAIVGVLHADADKLLETPAIRQR